ncbi:MAG TPA: hypothetical protein VII49_08180 [Rhizomicrobium sp.]
MRRRNDALPAMQWLMTRLLALGTALVITVALLMLAGMRVRDRPSAVAKPQPNELVIDIHPAAPRSP